MHEQLGLNLYLDKEHNDATNLNEYVSKSNSLLILFIVQVVCLFLTQGSPNTDSSQALFVYS